MNRERREKLYMWMAVGCALLLAASWFLYVRYGPRPVKPRGPLDGLNDVRWICAVVELMDYYDEHGEYPKDPYARCTTKARGDQNARFGE